MKKQKTPEVIRQDIPVFQADPERGLTMQQAEERKAGGVAYDFPLPCCSE